MLSTAMMEKICTPASGCFLAALDQSGGSTPKALKLYGIPDSDFTAGETSMFDAVHQMRSRIIESPSFKGDQILGAILFEDTMDRKINGVPTAKYLWESKHIIPFLKVDKGLATEENGVQLMKPIPGLDSLLKRAKQAGVFGTKMRSVIKFKSASADGINAIVAQQFEIGKLIAAAGLIPILEPEIDINSPSKEECEDILKACLMEHLNKLVGSDNQNIKIMLKLTIPSKVNLYQECIAHPNVIKVVALSGGYSRNKANELLGKQTGMVASFSRALSEGLNHDMSAAEFDKTLSASVMSIYKASKSG